jgi:hypothetical protein
MPDYSAIPQGHQQIMIDAVKVTATSLDEHVPNWVSLIDWDEFVFILYAKCIYGQLNRHSDVSGTALSNVNSGGFDVPREVQSEYPESLAFSDKQLLRESLWSFMQNEWKKIAGKDLTTAA